MAVHSKFLCAWSALVVAWLGGSASAELPVTQLRVLFPPVAQVGANSTVEVLGQGPLEEIDRLIFSHPGLSANLVAGESNPLTNEPQKVFGKFSLSVASDVPPGFYEAWAVGRNGVSSSRVMWVAPRRLLEARQPADGQQPPAQLTLDGIVVDRFAAAQIQRYDLPLLAGQRVRVTALDAKLDSRALSQLRILAPDTKLVAAAHSKGDAGATAEFTATEAGTYRVELRDSVYRGGDEFYFALFAELADAPRVDATSGPWTDPQQVLSVLAPSSGQLSRADELASLSVSRWLAGGLPKVLVKEGGFLKSPLEPVEPLSIAPPCVVSGMFAAPTGSDQAFDFVAKQGDTYWIDVVSSQLGESTDPHLSVYKVPVTTESVGAAEPVAGNPPPAAKLERVLEQDDPPVIGSIPFRIVRSDPSIKFQAPTDGKYRIVVRDQLASNAANAGGKYMVLVRQPQPSLALLAAWAWPTNTPAQSKPIGNHLLVAGRSAIRVIIERGDGQTGAVEVFCEGLPPGVTCPPVIVPADRDETHLILSKDDQPSAFTGPLKIVGRSLSDPSVQCQATPAELTWEPLPTWNAVTHRLSQQLWMSVSGTDTEQITFEVGSGEPLVMARGGKLPLPIKVTRRAGGKDKAVLRAQSLPAKTTLADVTIEAAASEAKPELVIAPDAPTGEATFWFQAETKVKVRNNPQALERAEAEKAQLEKLLADPARAQQKDAIAAAVKTVTDRTTKLKELTAEREQTVFIPTNSVRIRIVDGPVEPAAAWQIQAARGSESDHQLPLKRLFGFDEPINVTLVADAAASSGIEMVPAKVDKEAQQVNCHFKLAGDAAVGERKLQLKLAFKFNGHDLSVSVPLLLTVRE